MVKKLCPVNQQLPGTCGQHMLLHSGDGLAFGQGKSEQYRKPGTELTAALNAPSTDIKRRKEPGVFC